MRVVMNAKAVHLRLFKIAQGNTPCLPLINFPSSHGLQRTMSLTLFCRVFTGALPEKKVSVVIAGEFIKRWLVSSFLSSIVLFIIDNNLIEAE